MYFAKEHLSRLVLVGFFIVIILTIALPSYWTGDLRWSDVQEVNLSQLNRIKTTGLYIRGWQNFKVEVIYIDGSQWVYQVIARQPQQLAVLFMRTQPYYKDKPSVEWSDLEAPGGLQRDSLTRIKFTAPESDTVTARFLRARMNERTFAIVQWYAWLNGGSFHPQNWFWRDQLAQLQGKRLPWLAVSLHIPINPLSNLEQAREDAKSLATDIQMAINEHLAES
ncbi:MAG: cyanoexosortase B system-associated protein [Gloeocapsa sp. DLM2.Bin57]|nr:MAG: cyanoexosortase B system-associated protein [Gloeocapsa sp. DLM2.Bin57]